MRVLTRTHTSRSRLLIEGRHAMVARDFAGMICRTIDQYRSEYGPVAAVVSVRSLHSTPELGYRTRGHLVAEAEGVPGLLPGIAHEVVEALDDRDPSRRAIVVVYDEAMVPGRTCTVFELDLRTGQLLGDVPFKLGAV